MRHFSGRFEGISNRQATGWARSGSSLPVRVSLYVDNHYICSDLADDPHTDNESNGYRLPLPTWVFDEQPHSFDVRFTDINISLNGSDFIIIPDEDAEIIVPASLSVSKAAPEPQNTEPVRYTPLFATDQTASTVRIAYILSTHEGGVPETNRDLMAALDSAYEPWIISCDSRCINVFRFHPAGHQPVERIVLKTPIEPVSLQSADYDAAMSDLLKRYGFGLVHIRHMGWHAASLPALCKQLGLPVLMSLHDYYTICPSIKLLDDNKRYCGGTCTQGDGICEVELWRQDQFPSLKHGFVYQWRNRFNEALTHCDGFVTTSQFSKDLLSHAHPPLAQADFRLIEHGRDFSPDILPENWPADDQPLNILIPGGISPAKGANIINALIAQNTDGQLAFHILGNSWFIDKQSPHVFDHGPYKREDFASHLKAIRPHIGAVFSIWPETYCHTLSEMWACGLPVLGLDIGAVGERIKTHGGGWLIPVTSAPKEIYEALIRIKTDTDALVRIRPQLTQLRQRQDSAHTTAHMARAYETFYKFLLTSNA